MIEARNSALEYEHNQIAWLAWHIVRLGHLDPKKFPKLETLHAGKQQKKPRQTWQQQRQIMGMWSIAMQRVSAQHDERKKKRRGRR